LKQKFEDVDSTWSLPRARLMSLFLEYEAVIRRKCVEYKDIKRRIFYNDPNVTEDKELLEIYLIISKLLDEQNLTKLDTRREYDRTLVEEENKEGGL
jgi:hypothetical protein